jgi:hypothetical protein
MKTAHRKSHKSNRKQNNTQAGLNGNQPHTGKNKAARSFNVKASATRAAGASSPQGRTKKGSFHGLPEIWLPENNRYLSEFASELGRILSTQEVFGALINASSPKQMKKLSLIWPRFHPKNSVP